MVTSGKVPWQTFWEPCQQDKSAFRGRSSSSFERGITCDTRGRFWTTACSQVLATCLVDTHSAFVPALRGDLPAGTTLEARLSTPTGSRLSHTGDQVEGRTIAPVGLRGQILVPQGSRLFGSVESVKRFGLGLKQITAASIIGSIRSDYQMATQFPSTLNSSKWKPRKSG